jgi:arylsulfatase A-like enzyme
MTTAPFGLSRGRRDKSSGAGGAGIVSVGAAEAHGGVRLLVRVAALWWVLAALDVVLNVALPVSALRSREFPLPMRLAALAVDLSGLALALVVILGGGTLLERAAGRVPPLAPVAATLRRLRPALTWGLAALYVGSWGVYEIVGQFLDGESVAFWLAQPIYLFHWVGPWRAAALFGASLVLARAVGTWLPRLVRRGRPSAQQWLARSAGAVVFLALAGAVAGESMMEGLPPRGPEPPYPWLRDNRAGPFAHVLGEIRATLRSPPEPAAGLDEIVVRRHPIIPMTGYLAMIDRRSVTPNDVIVIVVESLRADQLRAYGAGRDVMPAVDALAREARVYTHAYTQASHSSYASPVPVSSHYPLRTPRRSTYPKDPPYPRVMLYDVLKPLGYRTGVFSSQNEHWEGMINYLQTGHIDRFFHPEVFDGPTYSMAGDTGFARWVARTKHAGNVDDAFTVAEAIRWIDEGGDRPFFLALNLQNSHLPYVVPDGFPRRFGPARPDFSISFARWPRGKDDVVKDLYADSLAYVDAQIGRLLHRLREGGRWGRTVVVVTGDHGQAFFEHGLFAHASALYDEVMRVPLVIRAPGLDPGADPRPAQHVDVAPSVFDLLGLPPHPSFQGLSLIHGSPNPDRSLYMVVQTLLADQYAIVRGRHKLIFDERYRYDLLFDLGRDPGERSNLASSRPDLVGRLARRLLAWRKAQVDYYADPARYRREYPPVLED